MRILETLLSSFSQVPTAPVPARITFSGIRRQSRYCSDKDAYRAKRASMAKALNAQSRVPEIMFFPSL